MSAPTCTCGHAVIDDRRCACLGCCGPCAEIDCCAETWASYIGLARILEHCQAVLRNTADEPERALQVSMKEIGKMAADALGNKLDRDSE